MEALYKLGGGLFSHPREESRQIFANRNAKGNGISSQQGYPSVPFHEIGSLPIFEHGVRRGKRGKQRSRIDSRVDFNWLRLSNENPRNIKGDSRRGRNKGRRKKNLVDSFDSRVSRFPPRFNIFLSFCSRFHRSRAAGWLLA